MIEWLKLGIWRWLHVCLVVIFLSFSLTPLGCSSSRHYHEYKYEERTGWYRSYRHSSYRNNEKMEAFGTILIGAIIISLTALTIHEISFKGGVTTIEISN